MGNTKTQFESKEALVAAMKHALVELILESDIPDALLQQYQNELEEVKRSSEVILREKGMIK